MRICANCGKANAPDVKFCGECGTALVADPPASASEERKVVSVLFCDLVGFTAASEQQDPEDVRARIRPYHARLRQEVEKRGGTVEKFIGDAVMAAFGAPVAHEDDAERAVRCGLAILDAIAELNDADPGLALEVRVGINSGEAVVALDARPELGEGLVTGDVVNTAARIEAAAPVNGVAVGDHTFRMTSHIFEYEPLDPITAKGKATPIPVWRARAVRDRYGSDSVIREYKTPFIGRELEKPLLIGIYERAAQQRSVQLVTIVGEPGVGKSRLAAELFSYIDAKPELIRWRQGRCLPYGEGITFWALGEIVKAESSILESDSAEVAAAKLETTLPSDDPDRQWLRERLAPLVGLEAASPAERQELFTAWRRYLEGLAAHRATILVFEDLHWADEALLDFLAYLVEWAEGVPLLVLCIARPELYERRPGWGAGLRNAHIINLSPLLPDETAELVRHLASRTALDDELELSVIERAEGNPLYAEEFVRLLSDRGLDGTGGPVGDSLPETVQALIAARLDTLPPDRKSLLQDAAVVGKVFWSGALTAISGHDARDVEAALHELTLKELVRRARTSSIADEGEYDFWHVLVRDVAYSQIPRAERARRHRAAARWIEETAGERVEEVAEVLAHHYLEALDLAESSGDHEQAAELARPARRYLALAGERALGLDTDQAQGRLARALELVPADDPERAELLVRWADAAFQAGQALDAAAAVDEALGALRTQGATEATASALQLRSRLAQRLGEGSHADLATEAVDLLERRPAGPGLVDAISQLANVEMVAGKYASAIAAADRARGLAASLGLAAPARALGYRGFARVVLGEADGLTEMEEALELLIRSGAGRDAAILQNNLALARYPLEGPKRTLATFEQGLAFCRQRGLAESADQLETNVPGLLAELGLVDQALERLRSLIPQFEARGDTYALVEARTVLAGCRFARGESLDRDECGWLVHTARTIGTIDIMVMAFAAAASVDGEAARELIAELLEAPGAPGSQYYPRCLGAMTRTALAAGEVDLARSLTAAVEPLFPLHEHARKTAAAQLAEAVGDWDDAADLYANAAARWEEFGNVPERAYALLGRARCLLSAGRPDSRPAREASEILIAMNYARPLDEARELLGRLAALTTS